MSTYLSSETLRGLRTESGLTQAALAERIGVTDKAVSKWETGRGLPDITLIDPLAAALGCSVAELLTGEVRRNANRSANMARCKFYVCPICGNAIVATGEGLFSCCGSTMLPQEAETPEPGSAHEPHIERIENDWRISVGHQLHSLRDQRQRHSEEALSRAARMAAPAHHRPRPHLPLLQPPRPVPRQNAEVAIAQFRIPPAARSSCPLAKTRSPQRVNSIADSEDCIKAIYYSLIRLPS